MAWPVSFLLLLITTLKSFSFLSINAIILDMDEKNNAIGNVRTAVIGAAAMLEKLQGMAWNVMIDSDDAQYDVMMGCNSLVLKKKDAVEN